MFIILLLFNILFLYFFWKIQFLPGFYVVGFFLSIILLLSFFTQEGQQTWKAFLKNFILTYLSYLNLLLVMIGLFFVFKYLFSGYWVQFVDIASLLAVLVVLMIFYILSVIIWKISWIKLAYFGFFVCWWLLWYFVLDWHIFNYFIAFLLAITVVWYLIYFVRFGKVWTGFLYILMINILVAFFILMYKVIPNPIALSNLVQFTILVILLFVLFLQHIERKLQAIEEKIKQYQHELNLFGYSDIKIEENEKNFYKKRVSRRYLILKILKFFLESPDSIKILFALTNTVPLLFASYYFFTHLQSGNYIQNELLYWLGAILFFINFLLFKKLNWFVTIQRFFAFFVINFVTYFTIIDFFGYNYLYVAIGGILWNLFSTVVILFIWEKEIFDWLDYLNWMIVNFLWVFINIYFLWKIWLNPYLEWGIILLYLGAYLFLYRIVYKKIFD